MREMGSDGKPKMVNGQYVYVKDKDGNYKYTKDAYTFGEGEKHCKCQVFLGNSFDCR